MKSKNLREVKKMMRNDNDWKTMLIRGSVDEILLDLDGDFQPDVALMDISGDGDIDTIAVDITGEGDFNLYFTDSDNNGIPDMVFLDAENDGNPELLAFGEEVEEEMMTAVQAIQLALLTDEYISSSLEEALTELDTNIKKYREAQINNDGRIEIN
ncbi:MAG: hypothetical protein LUD18_13090 [Lachnospiraceae bacterium]|nr:hypothetical protein [Lachnospiraceae bacterium]